MSLFFSPLNNYFVFLNCVIGLVSKINKSKFPKCGINRCLEALKVFVVLITTKMTNDP